MSGSIGLISTPKTPNIKTNKKKIITEFEGEYEEAFKKSDMMKDIKDEWERSENSKLMTNYNSDTDSESDGEGDAVKKDKGTFKKIFEYFGEDCKCTWSPHSIALIIFICFLGITVLISVIMCFYIKIREINMTKTN